LKKRLTGEKRTKSVITKPFIEEAETLCNRIGYKELPEGAPIKYWSEKPALIDEKHRFFDAQATDHTSASFGPPDQDNQ
jgi:hypothetical protein